jgi:hypothetical protein
MANGSRTQPEVDRGRGETRSSRSLRREPELAEELRLTARELMRLGVADDVLPKAGPDLVDLVRDRVLAGLDAPPAGNRTLRADRATRAWLQTAPERIDLAC